MAVKNVLFKIQAETAGLRKELEAVKAQIAGVGKATDDATKKVSLLQKTLAGAAAAFGGVQVAAAAIDFGKGAIQAVANYESLGISFETFLGSAEKAKEVLADLEKFSVATPFTPEQVNNAGKALLAFGEPVQQLQSTLQKIGDVSSATGKDFNELAVIYGKARVAGTLYAEDINQLTEAGVPIIQEFAKELKVSEDQVKKLGSEGKISFDVFERAFANLTEEGGRFFGLTEKLSQSTAGRISTLEGNFEQLKRSIGEGLLPVFEGLLSGAQKVIDVFAALPGFLQQNGRSLLLLAGAVAFYVGQQKSAVQVELISNVQKGISAVRDRAAALALSIRTGATKAAALATNLFTNATNASAVATQVATAATTAFSTALKTNPIGLILTGLSVAAALFLDFGDSVEMATEEQDNFISTAEALAQVTNQTNAEFAKEKVELDRLFGALRETNAGSQERVNLINEINSKYGTTLKNISDETAFVSQLDKVYRELAESIKAAARAKAVEGQLIELTKQQIALEDQLFQFKQQEAINLLAQDKVQGEERAKLLAQFNQSEIKAIEEQAAALQEKIKANNAADYLGSAEKLNQDLLASGGVLKDAVDERKKLIEQQLEDTNATIDKLAKIGAESTAKGNKLSKEELKAAEKLANDRKKLLADLLREIQKLNLEIETQPVSFINPLTAEQEISKLRALLELRKKEIDQDLDNRIKEARENGTLTGTIAQQFEILRGKQKQKATNETENAITNIEIKAAKNRAKTLNDINNVNNAIILENIIQDTKALEKERSKLLKELSVANTPEQRAAIKTQLDENLKLIEENLADEKRIKIAAIEEQRDFDLQQQGLTEEDKKLIVKNAELEILKTEQDFADRSVKIAEDESERKKRIKEEERLAIIKGIEEVAKATLSAVNDVIAARIAETETAINGQQRRVDAAKEIAEKGNAELLQIEEERLRKLNEQKARFVRQQQALAAIELVANSSVAIAKAAAEGGAAAPFTIAATLIALAAGLVQARAQARAAASFAKGGYTGDGGKFEEAGVVHKGEFVITKEKTRRFRPLLEAIHAGRDPKLASNINSKMIVINNSTTDARLERIEKAIRQQKGLSLSIDERGINGIVSRLQYKEQRIRNKAK